MTVEETKKVAQVMQDWAAGKEIQFRPRGCENKPWETFIGKEDIDWDLTHWEFRVKPEPYYRPFESADEVMEAIKEKGQYLMHKCPKGYYHITCVYPERPDLENSPLRIRINGKVHIAEDMMNYYEWADGTPFGKLEE